MARFQIPQALVPADIGGMTLISTTTLSGGTTTISNIPTGYVNLMLILRDQTSGDNTSLRMRLNNDSTQRYFNMVASGNPGSVTGNVNNTYFELGPQYSVGTNYEYGSGVITFFDYTNTTGWKIWQHIGIHTREGSDQETSPRYDIEFGGYSGGSSLGNTSAISSITFIPSIGTGLGGTALLYGVK